MMSAFFVRQKTLQGGEKIRYKSSRKQKNSLEKSWKIWSWLNVQYFNYFFRNILTQ